MRRVFASVVPYATDDQNKTVLLLAREAFGSERGTWASFSGGYLNNRESELHAAARECFEESMGLLGSEDYLRVHLRHSATRLDVSRGVHYLYKIPYEPSLPERFEGIRKMYSKCVTTPTRYTPFIEKDVMQWVPSAAIPDSMKLRKGFDRDLSCIRGALAIIHNTPM